MAEPHSPQARGAEVELIRGLVNRLLALTSLARQGRMDSPEGEHQAELFASQAAEALQSGVPIQLALQPRALTYNHVEVAGADLISRQMVEGLFAQGLRLITIEPNARPIELASLGRLLTMDWTHRTALDEDLEARAWRMGFDNIHLELANRDVVGDDDDDVLPDEMVRRLIRRLGATEIQDEAGGLELEVAGLMDELAALGGQGQHPPPLREGPELAQLQRQLDLVRQGKDVDDLRLGKVIFETLRNHKDADAARRLVERLVEHIRRLLTVGAVEEVNPLLHRIFALAERDAFAGFSGHPGVVEGLAALIAPETVEAVRYGWERRPDGKAWSGLLFTLGASSRSQDLGAIAALGMAIPDREVRQALADGLVLTLEREKLSAKEALHSAPEAVAPIILFVLRRRPEPMLLEAILARVQSASEAVREAALVALRDHQSPRTREVVRAALSDSAAAVRTEALRYLVVYRDEASLPQITERLHAATDESCEPAELRALAIASANLGREKAVAELERIAASLDQSRHTHLPIAALYGLRAAGPPGKAALERLGRTTPALREELHKILGGAA